MLDIENCCLTVIDVQGKLAQLAHDKEALFRNIEILIQTAKALDIPILWCQQNPKALGPTIPQLAALLSGVDPIDKFSFSCCRDKKFISRLDELNRRQAILCGIESHVCVCQTALDFLDNNYEVYVAADTVSSRTAENKAIGLNRMQAEGIRICSTEMVMFELLKTSEHEKFKELARLIK
jgi:nicotinamidase-related amidase